LICSNLKQSYNEGGVLDGNKRHKTNSRQGNKYLSFDQTIHQTLADFNSIYTQEDKTLKVLYDFLHNNWTNDGYLSDKEEQKFKLRAYNMLLCYFHNQHDRGYDNFIINRILSKRIDRKKLLIAKVDKAYERHDGNLEIIDYKTGYIVNHQNDFELDLKSAILIDLATMKLGISPNFISYYYLRHNKKFTLKITKEVINLSKKLINQALQVLEVEKF
jgi:hypothetical protein